MKFAQNVWRLRCVFITPLGLPVVPPVGMSATTSCGLVGHLGRRVVVARGPLVERRAAGRRRRCRSSGGSAGSADRISAMTGSNAAWKNSTSQSKLSRIADVVGHRVAGVHGHPRESRAPEARARRSTRSDRSPASTAPLVSFGRPRSSSAFAMRHERRPTSSNPKDRVARDVGDAVGVAPPAAVEHVDDRHVSSRRRRPRGPGRAPAGSRAGSGGRTRRRRGRRPAARRRRAGAARPKRSGARRS